MTAPWAADREALWRVLHARRDHRHFRPDPVAAEALERVLDAFRVAPSVGLSQPWHVTVVRSARLRDAAYQSFAGVRTREQERFGGERRALYDTLKLEGIREAPVGLVVSFVPPESATLGTTSLPAALEYSVVSAITLTWPPRLRAWVWAGSAWWSREICTRHWTSPPTCGPWLTCAWATRPWISKSLCCKP
ncbi:hypothetical protein GCM10008955_09230 [Deinococcus malanensis]|uniref:Nitroreductase domain-containing protein n=1 Tax=Deinococcus malanensis TaxID=1706855 RepID=A0ABQ2EN23_9DEIO|nr:nitroreductase family protein [Deinococcus malanensis]GGK17961.1 hypothetical protein GCM10008955_09230 [Deinococcus malanensis]